MKTNTRVVWKYVLSPEFVTHVKNLPKDAKILHVGQQGDCICLWLLVDAQAEKERRTFHIVGTGKEFFLPGAVHVGTVQMQSGAFAHLVLHVFECTKNHGV